MQLLPPPLPARRRDGRPVQCSQQHGNSHPTGAPGSERDSLAVLTLKAVMLASAGNAVLACLAVSPAQAAVAGSWQPRRHTQSSLREAYITEETPKQAAKRKAAQRQQAAQAAAERQAAQPEAPTGQLQQVLQSAQARLQRLWRGDSAVYSAGIQADRRQTYGGTAPPTASPWGWLPLAAAGGLLLLVLFGRNLRLPWASGPRGERGRWVRDRSLGGKMVFIPDAELAPKAPRPLFEDDSAGEAQAAYAASKAASAATTAGPAGGGGGGDSAAGAVWGNASGAKQQQAQQAQLDLPVWWQSPSFLVYSSMTRKEELQRQARQVLRQLEDAKMLKGLDYPLSALVTLRTLCQEAGGYQVKPRTESGRDAMLRAGVRAAIAAAQEGQYAMLGGDKPNKFVCGLAHDLGVPDARAVVIVHAEVAAICRAALIDAEAAFRSGNQGDLLLALVRVAGALQAFPLPAGSAEAELVAAGVVKQTGMEFRKAIFLEFGSVDASLAALVAELLGFDPALVMPALQQELAGQAATAAAAGAMQALAGQQQAQQQGERGQGA